jgi:hypothetical protein
VLVNHIEQNMGFSLRTGLDIGDLGSVDTAANRPSPRTFEKATPAPLTAPKLARCDSEQPHTPVSCARAERQAEIQPETNRQTKKRHRVGVPFLANETQSRQSKSRAKQSTAKHSTAEQSKAKHSKAQQSTAKHSKAKQSKAQQSKAKQRKQSRAEQSK